MDQEGAASVPFDTGDTLWPAPSPEAMSLHLLIRLDAMITRCKHCSAQVLPDHWARVKHNCNHHKE